MRTISLMIGAAVLAAVASAAQAAMPPNVRCAIHAQEAARDMGSQYQETYKRKFELCMLKAMPQERQTTYLIERLRPYVAISPGVEKQAPARRKQPEFSGTWVRVSPHVWVLNR